MAKVKGKLGNDFCPQSLFLYGTKKDDGSPNFGLFCWFSYATIEVNKEPRMGVMACIGEEKLTKDLIRKNGSFSANLVTEKLLPLADYYGCTSGRNTAEGSDIFICEICNVMIEEKLKDKSLSFIERLKIAAPVITAGETTYTSIDGRELGRWGQPMKSMKS